MWRGAAGAGTPDWQSRDVTRLLDASPTLNPMTVYKVTISHISFTFQTFTSFQTLHVDVVEGNILNMYVVGAL